MRVLILGSGGMLAHDVVATAPPDVEVVTPPERDADITDPAAMTRVLAETAPDVVINCAAYTNVDGAEADRDRAFEINAHALATIGHATRLSSHVSRLSSHISQLTPLVIHFSTDYVFPGTATRPYREDDATDPTGAYGKSKLAGERALAESGARYLIVRTSWLFGAHGKSFPRTMWERARAGQPTRVVKDQTGRATYTRDLAGAVWHLATGIGNREAGIGILHIANVGVTTWYEIARRVFEAAGAPDLVTPCTTAEYPTPAKRPAYSVLDTTRADSLLGAPLPSWDDALNRFLAELK